MPASACSEITGFESLMDDAISPDRRRQRETHLETCLACQERLDRAAAENDALLTMARQEGDPTTRPADPTLTDLLTRLRNDDFPEVRSSSGPLDLGFLCPTTRPELLGTLGDYEITEVLGRGATGIVLKAFDPALRRTVAIKVLAPAVAADPIARQRFTREARAAAAVSHDNVVSVFAVHESDRVPYFAMQYVAGMSLQQRLDRTGRLPQAAILRIGAQVAHGLAAAHAQGLVHRDIKPANILLEGDVATEPIPSARVKAKLTDFGLARTTDDLQLTQDGIAAGTPQYMAPEQARAEPVDARSDLFSLGSVLYAMSTGSAPFRGPSAVAVLRQVSDDKPAPLRTTCPDVPDCLAAIVERLMAKDPSARIQTAAELANLLDRLAAEPANVTAILGRKPAPVAPKRGWLSARRILVASFVLLAIGVGFGSWLLAPEGLRDLPPEKKARMKATFDFRNGLEKYPALSTNGPDVENIFKTEPNGLRVTLPAGRDDTRPVRIEFTERIRGDFEIVLDGELLSVGTPLPRYGAGIALNVLLDSPNSAVVSIYRKPQGDSFGAHKLVMGPDEKNKYVDNAGLKARRPSGKLRLVRTGSVLQYFVAEEGGEYQRILSSDIGTEDVTMVRLECSTMYDPVALEVRLRSLTIEATDLPAALVAAQASDTPANPTASPTTSPQQPPSRLRLFFTVAVAVLLLGCAAVVFLFARRRAKIAAPAPSLISFKCTRCGRGLKGKPSHLGRKVKCPGCGEITPVSPSPSGRPQVAKGSEKR